MPLLTRAGIARQAPAHPRDVQTKLAFNRTRPANFTLKRKNAIEKSLCGWRTARHINIDRNNPVATPYDLVGIMVVTAAIGT